MTTQCTCPRTIRPGGEAHVTTANPWCPVHGAKQELGMFGPRVEDVTRLLGGYVIHACKREHGAWVLVCKPNRLRPPGGYQVIRGTADCKRCRQLLEAK